MREYSGALCPEEKDSQRSISVLKVEVTKSKEKITKICHIKDLKASVDQIYWMGPNCLLILDSQYHIYYVEVEISLFFKNFT